MFLNIFEGYNKLENNLDHFQTSNKLNDLWFYWTHDFQHKEDKKEFYAWKVSVPSQMDT